jgi:hypothetical protein
MAGDAAKQPLVQLQRKLTSSAKQTMEFEGLRVRFSRIAAGKFDQQKCWIANLPTLERYL